MTAILLCVMTFATASLAAGATGPATPHTPQELMKALIENERQAMLTHERYEYLSNERSDRTAGHLWTERVVETSEGRVRLLLAVDGRPLTPEQMQVERARLEAISADPRAFIQREQAQRGDEEKARHLLEVLPAEFLFDNVRLESGVWRMDFHPNPAVAPVGVEDRVLHGMIGTLAIDAQDLRLIHIQGDLPVDVNIGFGLVANIKAGSRFASDRALVDGHWRTVRVVTDIRGKAGLFKSVSRNSDLARSEFRYLSGNLTVPQAVAMLLPVDSEGVAR